VKISEKRVRNGGQRKAKGNELLHRRKTDLRTIREVKTLFLMLVAALLSAQALAQPGPRERGQGLRAPSHLSQDDRRRLREDVDQARDSYDRRGPRREERMGPEEREKLRRDIQDANREMRRRR
jgi:hypothetical protein